ncbi:hypothetical protein Prudu_021156 [Prunus dulcis]|uniref:Uncharacterized protein n=1 Tax=Prunus dulcis TaxID=3755 RepID=A0A4Y1RY73_PRUDU|nr:hypothetical protein Prudu_021156 [Prunus dulcis]
MQLNLPIQDPSPHHCMNSAQLCLSEVLASLMNLILQNVGLLPFDLISPF